MHLTPATIVIALAATRAAATGGYGGWGGHASYSTPDNTDNKCSTEQSGGYDWTGLDTGSFNTYGSNKFSAWNCSNSFGKRDLLTKRTFQSKCITADLDDEPAIDCDGEDKMSIKKYEVSSDQDADIECHYEMPDGSACKEIHSCKAGGSVIENTQCGGAKKVTFKPHKDSKGKRCNIGVHSIDFDCKTASVPSYSASSTAASSPSQPPIYTSSSASSADSPPSSAPSYGTESASTYDTSSTTEQSPVTTSASPPVYPSASPTLPGYGNSSAPAPSYGPSSETTKTPLPTSYTPQPESPDVLPKCINSWLYLVDCKGNDDYDCFCKNADFMGKVYNCLSSWSTTDDDTNSGAGYLMGLCAKYVPENPAIITACPSTITPATGYAPPASTPSSPVTSGGKKTVYSTIISTAVSCGSEVKDCPATTQTSTLAVATTVETAGVTPPPAVPCTTITYSSTQIIPATYSTGESQGSPIPSSSYTTSIVTTVTVPQVQITTYTVTESGSTHETPGLGYETPPAQPAPAPSSSAPSAPAPVPYPTSSEASPVGGFGTTYSSPSHTLTPYTGAGARASFNGVVCMLFAFAVVVHV